LYTSSSRFSFAMIDAAETTGWLASALCSQEREMFSGSLRSFWTSVVHDWMLTDGQSIMTLTFSFRSFVSSFMIFAAFSASKRFRFVWSSISFGDEVSI